MVVLVVSLDADGQVYISKLFFDRYWRLLVRPVDALRYSDVHYRISARIRLSIHHLRLGEPSVLRLGDHELREAIGNPVLHSPADDHFPAPRACAELG